MIQIHLQPRCGCGTYMFNTHDTLDSAPRKEEIELTKLSPQSGTVGSKEQTVYLKVSPWQEVICLSDSIDIWVTFP